MTSIWIHLEVSFEQNPIILCVACFADTNIYTWLPVQINSYFGNEPANTSHPLIILSTSFICSPTSVKQKLKTWGILSIWY